LAMYSRKFWASRVPRFRVSKSWVRCINVYVTCCIKYSEHNMYVFKTNIERATSGFNFLSLVRTCRYFDALIFVMNGC
jgi:hypothetical protein